MSSTPNPNETPGRYVLLHGGWMLESVRPQHRETIADLINGAPVVVVHDVMELTHLSSNTVVKALLGLGYVQLNDGNTLVDSSWELNPEMRQRVRFRPRRNGTYLKTRELIALQQDHANANADVAPDTEAVEDVSAEDEPADLILADGDSWPLNLDGINVATTSLQEVFDMATTMGLTVEIRVHAPARSSR